MKVTNLTLAVISVVSFHPSLTRAGPLAYGICQAGCASVVMACYAAAGATWGVTAGATAPATVAACNSAFGACQAACVAAGFAPTP